MLWTKSGGSHGKQLGTVGEICAYGFKSPPKPMHFEEAYTKFAAAFVR